MSKRKSRYHGHRFPPQIVLLSAYFDEHLVDIPCIAEPALASFRCHAIAQPKLQTPAAYGLVGNLDTALGKNILNVPEAQAEAVTSQQIIEHLLKRVEVP